VNIYSIYKIEHRTNPELVYVGSTKNFKVRKKDHKCQSQTSNIKVYQMIREHGGWEQFDMIELNQVECTQLEAREEEDRVRIELNARMNTLSAVLDIENRNKKIQEYHQSHREEIKQRHQKNYQEHREERIQQSKEYRQEHHEERKQKDRQYYQAHREKYNQQSKEYQQSHREQIKQKKQEPYTCGCGSQITQTCKARHLRSQKHIEWASI